MNRENFLKCFDIEDKLVVSNLYEKICMCEKTNKIKYSELFLTPRIWRVVEQMHDRLPCEVKFEGVFSEAERKYAIIRPYSILDFNESMPIKVLRIKKQSKYNKLYHRNYLGSLVHLGLKREVFGDLIIDEDKCYCPVIEKVSDFVRVNLDKINNVPVKVNLLDINTDELPEYSFFEKVISVPSLRLDAIIAASFNIPRGNAVATINGGGAFINYKKNYKNDYKIKENDIITLRGKGKLVVKDVIGQTKKGKLKLKIKIYN
ncbi:hypothetical protein SH2C18_05160 [Clostridium sediminicola]|uniref:YlmH family RNA-binding protein n=1 Tax=Clostridium sediminicola TaxID=3114879 RepID=UPI0031F20C40